MRTWKLKVGGGEPAAEGARVASLLAGCDALGLRLRLDANQAWDRTGVRTFCDALKAGWRQHLPRPTHVAAEEEKEKEHKEEMVVEEEVRRRRRHMLRGGHRKAAPQRPLRRSCG